MICCFLLFLGMRGYDSQPYLSLWGGLQVAEAIPQSLCGEAELAVLFLDAGDTLEHHLIILSEIKQKVTAGWV